MPNLPPANAVYKNPFRAARVSPSRIDQGVDYFAPAGDPIFAIGPGVVDQVYSGNSGWPGGGWVSYLLTAGPAKGHRVFVAEDVAPAVSVGEKVTADTVVARFNQAGSIETGWAGPLKLGDQTLAAYLNEWYTGPGGDPGRYSTAAGVTFSNLLASLGAPAGHLTPGGIRGPNQAIVAVAVSQTTPGAGAGQGASGSPGGTPGCVLSLPSLGPISGGCILTTSQARGVIGGLMIAAALPVGMVGAIVLAAFTFRRSGAGGAIGRSAEAAGTGIAFIPGMQGAGAAVAAAGSAEARKSQGQQRQRQAKETGRRQAREKREGDAQARHDESEYKKVQKRTGRQSSSQRPPEQDTPPF